MIKSIGAKGIHGSYDFYYEFNDDINIITGKNGVGKTTLIKLIWYVISGNINTLCKEISFDRITITTETDSVTIYKTADPLSSRWFVDYYINGESKAQRTSADKPMLFDWDLSILPFHKVGSCYFPTFRRIEGGYGIEHYEPEESRYGENILQLLNSFSSYLSNTKHKFVTAVSARDINSLVRRQRSAILDKMEEIQIERNKVALDMIKHATDSATKLSVLEEIQESLERTELIRKDFNRPLETLWSYLSSLFQYTGIAFGRGTILGDENNPIITANMSSGEKQMLSFLAYNAFITNSCFFIDEPEISLHPDWQRKLIPMLLEQNRSNQFFIVTHSPFIYSMYSDKEIALDNDKGE